MHPDPHDAPAGAPPTFAAEPAAARLKLTAAAPTAVFREPEADHA